MLTIEQALYGSHDAGGYRFLAQSPGFAPEWLPVAERLCTGFGERPAGIACPLAVFALPLGRHHVAVVQAADQGRDDAGRPGALAFRLLAVPRSLYADLGGDLFHIAETLPPDWGARGELPALEWTAGPPPRRSVDEVRRVLNVPHDRTALLLGGAQVLVDGGRLMVRRPAPDPQLARDLWALLPDATRAEAWPASFAFGNRHRFHLAIVPDAAADDFADYVAEAAAGDYPEGRFESALHHAAETGDQAEVDRLFRRPSRRQRLKLALWLLGLFALVPIVLALPIGPSPAPPVKQEKEETPKQGEAPPAEGMRLPDEPPLGAPDPMRRELRDGVNRLLRRLGAAQTEKLDDASVADAIRRLDRLVREKAAAPRRDAGDLAAIQDPRRLMRAVLYRHGIAEYAEPGLNAAEMVERLEARLVEERLIEGER